MLYTLFKGRVDVMNDMYYHHHPSKAMAMAGNNDPSHSDGKHF